MNLKYDLLPFAISILLLTSCSKDPDPETTTPDTVDSCKLLRVEYTIPAVSGYIRTQCRIVYNGDKISEIRYEDDNGSPFAKDVFFYDANNEVSRRELYNFGDSLIDESHNYREAFNPGLGLFLQSIDSNYYNGLMQPTGFTAYRFNNFNTRDYITDLVSDNPNAIFEHVKYSWQHNDPVQFTFVEPNSSQLRTTTITYDTTKLNTFNQQFPKFWFFASNHSGNLFLPGEPKFMQYILLGKHLIKKVVSTGHPYYQITGDFTYAYNSKGLITEVLVDGYTIFRFTYSCL
jgi:hypothetical protein